MATAWCTIGSSTAAAHPARSLGALAAPALMLFDNDKRPAWLNWLFLAIFLWSSWQLAGMWFSQLHQG
jgi:hypothetical protein